MSHLYETITGPTFAICIGAYAGRFYAEVFEVEVLPGRFARELRTSRYNGLRAGDLYDNRLLADMHGRAVAEGLARKTAA